MLPFFIALWLVRGLDIEDFGAIHGDFSKTVSLVNGQAFNKAVLAAQAGTDKTVTIRAGREYSMLPAGVIENLTDIEIVVDGTIHAWEGSEEDWPLNSSGDVLSLIELQYTQNLVIRGNGTIDGHGYRWWWKTIITGHDNRPVLLTVQHAVDTLLEGVTFKNSPKYHIDLKDMLRCTVQDLTVHVDITDDKEDFLKWLPTFPLNTDGIDIAGRDIYFRNLTIICFDDAVAVKPMHVGSGLYSNCTENLLVEDSYVKYGVGMSIGSVPPNDNLNCIRNVTFNNIKFDYPLKAIYIKPNPGTHGRGLISQITYQNIEIREALWWAIFIGTQQQSQPGGYSTGCSFLYPLPGAKCPTDPLVTVDQITLRNVNIHGGVFSPGILICNSTNPCTNFVFDNVNVYDRSPFPEVEGFLCENVQGIARNSNLYPRCFTKIDDETPKFLE
mmetsp:Transcript_6990/g.12839  ORF Transcript_6990/g.12839 Transcript_6990/m.12839 type:complete len:441 (-) Transcript_6990:29-1351(-)